MTEAVGKTGSALAKDGVPLGYGLGDRSDGPTMVLLHSLGTDRHIFDECAEALAARYRLVVPDSRGHGESDSSKVASVDQWVDDLDHVLDAAHTQNVLLVGVSMGGIQALAYAAAFPERVRALVVADSFVALPPDVAEAKIRGLRDQCANSPMSEIADQYVAETFEAPYPAGAAAVRQALAGMDAASYLAAVQVCFSVRISDRLADVAAPALVLWGERDGKAPRSLSEQIVEGLPCAQFQVVPDAGHLSNIDNPDAFAAAVLGFSAERGSRAASAWLEGGQ